MKGRSARFQHFNKEFEKELSQHSTYQQAYEATEKKFNDRIGYDQYSGWDSFKNVRSRNLRKRK